MMKYRFTTMRRAKTALGYLALVACLLAGVASAQVPMNLPTDHIGIVALHAQQLNDEMAYRKMLPTKEPGAQLELLIELLRQHSSYFETKGGVYSATEDFDSYTRRAKPNPQTLKEKLQAVQTAMQAVVPSFYVGAFDSEMARTLFKEHADLTAAESLAQSGVSLYDQSACLQDDRYGAESHHVYDENQAKHPVPFTYHVEEGQQHCVESIASRYAILGKIEAKQGNVVAASAAFEQALREHPNVDAALGLAAIDKSKGSETDELQMLSTAFLTGSLSPTDVKTARALYQKLNPANASSDYDASLDRLYAQTFANPVIFPSTPPLPSTSQHVVLEELFTGADCEPCIAPDLATEAALRYYSRDRVIVAVYHDNAPGPDPLTTIVSETRGKYYGTGGSTPHVIVDGKELEIEEGPPSHAQSSFEIITTAIDPLRSSPSKATLQLTAQLRGDFVEVGVKIRSGSLLAKTHLQIFLLETEISDTGRNTLRFQPMVVRAAATTVGGDFGFALNHEASVSQRYSFDLKKVEAENLDYYDHYRDELQTRMAPFLSKGYMTKARIDDMAQFREPRNEVHPDRLAVVAFLQSDETKEVFQSIYTAVLRSEAGDKR